ncbi:MAG: class I SAM-dependent methyltransferase [Gemmatimonadota bacterium]
MSEHGSRTTVRVRESFADVAGNYRRSRRHGDPEALRRMLALIAPTGEERVLDLATGGGHTAAALAPFVERVVASDLLPEMLREAAALFTEGAITNADLLCSDAQALPFGAETFDLVTCRCAPHHFPDVRAFGAEVRRVLRPGGRVYLMDCGVPGDAAAAAFVNDVERERDPAHVRALSCAEWNAVLRSAGLEVLEARELPSVYRVPEWLEQLRSPPQRRAAVLARLADAPRNLAAPVAIDLTPGEETFTTLRVEALARRPT